MPIKHNRDLTRRAQTLRRNATPQERHLWYDFLSGYPVRFKRQVTIDRFIVDFYCAEAKLVIELDGSQHYEDQGLAYDEQRSAILEGFGLKVLRFSNADIDKNFSGVCQAIEQNLKEATQ